MVPLVQKLVVFDPVLLQKWSVLTRFFAPEMVSFDPVLGPGMVSFALILGPEMVSFALILGPEIGDFGTGFARNW